MTYRDDPSSPPWVESAHRSQPGFEPSVIGLNDVRCVLLEHVPPGGHEFVEYARIDRRPVGGDLDMGQPLERG